MSYYHFLNYFVFVIVGLFLLLRFLPKEVPLAFVGGLVVLNSLSFCLSVMVLISPSNLNEILAR